MIDSNFQLSNKTTATYGFLLLQEAVLQVQGGPVNRLPQVRDVTGDVTTQLLNSLSYRQGFVSEYTALELLNELSYCHLCLTEVVQVRAEYRSRVVYVRSLTVTSEQKETET